jgi:hypothetical protein
MAIVRWAKEVWLLGQHEKPGDALTPLEVCRAADIINKPKKCKQGPLLAVKEALQTLGWTLQGGGGILVIDGVATPLKYHSPREIGRMVVESWQVKKFKEATEKMEKRQQEMAICRPMGQWCQQLARDLVNTRNFSGKERALAYQLLAGVAPTGQWYHEHGWCSNGKCGCGNMDTIQHRLGGCDQREACPYGTKSYVDFWLLVSMPEVPARRHPEGFNLCMDGEGTLSDQEDLVLQQGTFYADGSVRWPRWKDLATGGLAVVARDPQVVIYAESAADTVRQTAVNMEMASLRAAITRITCDSKIRIGMDCQAVVDGWKKRVRLGQEANCLHAGHWRFINEFMDMHQPDVQVFKIKAHREKSSVPQEEMADYLGNDLADVWAKQAAGDRTSVLLMDSADEILTQNLAKARKVVSWLAAGSWPNGKELGRPPGRGVRTSKVYTRMGLDQGGHWWLWQGKAWRCGLCSKLTRSRSTQRRDVCPGSIEKAGVHPSHKVVRATGLTQFWICVACGGTRTGSHGLTGPCHPGTKAAGERIKLLRKDLHPYSRLPITIGRWQAGISEVGIMANAAHGAEAARSQVEHFGQGGMEEDHGLDEAEAYSDEDVFDYGFDMG